MCWCVPGKIIETDGDVATVEIFDLRRRVSTDLISDPRPGEYVLVHAGYAIQKVDEESAKFTIDFFKEGMKDA